MDLKLGDKIRLKRKQAGMTLKELSSDRVTPAQISAIEKGKCKPSPELLQFIADRLDLDVEYFLLTDEERYRRIFDELKDKTELLYKENKYDEAILLIDEAKEYLAYLRDDQKGYYYYLFGNCFFDRRDYVKSLDFFMRAITYYLMTSDKTTIVNLYTKIGNCLFNTEKFDIALSYYQNSIKYIDDNSAPYIKLRAWYNISLAYLKVNKFNQAQEFLTLAQGFLEQNTFEEKDSLIPRFISLQGMIDLGIDGDKDGIDKFQEAFDKYKSDNNTSGMAAAKNNLATCFWEIGEGEKAISCLKEAIEYHKLTNKGNIIIYYLNLAEVYDETGQLEKALETIASAEEVALNSDTPEALVKLFVRKFEYLYKLADYEKAENVAFYALNYIQKLEDTKAEANIYLKLSEMYKNMGDNKNSIEYFIKARNLM